MHAIRARVCPLFLYCLHAISFFSLYIYSFSIDAHYTYDTCISKEDFHNVWSQSSIILLISQSISIIDTEYQYIVLFKFNELVFPKRCAILYPELRF